MKPRHPLDIATTRGYVILIKGKPGTGKTSFSLVAGSRFGKVSYISFSEPENYIRKKLNTVTSKKVKLNYSAILGNTERAVSDALGALASGNLVILDSINAMLSSVKEKRPIEQLLYGASKGKEGSLLLIHEGLEESEADYISDAILAFGYTEVHGRKVRSISVLKDRNYPIRSAPYLFTFYKNRIKIFESSVKGELEAVGPIKKTEFPEPPYSFLSENNVLVKVSGEVHQEIVRLMKLFFSVYYSKEEKNIVLELSPNEDLESAKAIISALSGNRFEPLVLRKPYLKNYAEAREYLESFENTISNIKTGGMLITDTRPDESFAISDVASYDGFVQQKVQLLAKYNFRRIIFSYENFASTPVNEKYADSVKVVTDHYGTLVWISEKPPGNAYAIETDVKKFELRNYRLV
ncbi:MAG: RAD55 family ATPase [Nitrososphaeria archaeon]|nr:ATPase domain-containing protein [Conexivisphaerales archaeon]